MAPPTGSSETQTRKRGRPKKEASTEGSEQPTTAASWKDPSKIAKMFMLQCQTHSDYFIEGKDKNDNATGWDRILFDLNLAFVEDVALTMDQLKAALPATHCAAMINETGNKKAPKTPAWFDDVHAILGPRKGLGAMSFGNSDGLEIGITSAEEATRSVSLIDVLLSKPTPIDGDLLDSGRDSDSSDSESTAKRQKKLSTTAEQRRVAVSMNAGSIGLPTKSRRRSDESADNSASEIVAPFDSKKKKQDLAAAVAAVGTGINEGMASIAGSFKDLAQAIGGKDSSSEVVRAVDVLQKEMREAKEEQKRSSDALLAVLGQLAASLQRPGNGA
ncbi:hypothetical protein BDR26DRAFT_867016 [Obelidium mucronatum]|nr:hypothetical protein BDR26DRAFT_867016 [Obelidium mucronatum]